jgi:hypothetical protein
MSIRCRVQRYVYHREYASGTGDLNLRTGELAVPMRRSCAPCTSEPSFEFTSSVALRYVHHPHLFHWASEFLYLSEPEPQKRSKIGDHQLRSGIRSAFEKVSYSTTRYSI